LNRRKLRVQNWSFPVPTFVAIEQGKVKGAQSYPDIFYDNFDNGSLCGTRPDKKCNTECGEKGEFAQKNHLVKANPIYLLKHRKSSAFRCGKLVVIVVVKRFEKLEFAKRSPTVIEPRLLIRPGFGQLPGPGPPRPLQ
jgi:hypothetical protein